MHKTGAIILGVGGDNVSGRRRRRGGGRSGNDGQAAGAPTIPGMSVGTFYEGAMTAGYSSDAADDAVQADVLAAGFGQ